METQAAPPDGPDARSPPAAVTVQDTTGSTVISPFSQAMDLSTSTDEHGLVMPGEKTPISFGEVPGFVLAKVREEDISTDPLSNSSTSSQKRSAARVCLETRFNTVSADTPRQQDVQSTVFSNFLTIFQQSAEAPEGVVHPQMQKGMTDPADKANPYEVSGPFVGSVLNPVTNRFEQVISHIPHRIDPQHQGLIIPKSFSFNFLLDSVVKKAHYTNGNNSAEEQQLENKENDVATSAAFRKHGNTHSSHPRKGAKAAGSGSNIKKKIQAHLSPSQRREKHNSKERERRKRIRLCCDELNMLVPFCNSDTDKVTTLQWTTAFLGYLTKTYGDTFKDEFKRAFIDERGHFLKSSPSSSHDPMQREMDESLTTPLTVEQ
ncbi:transcription factor-like 5 protein isoform X2 [Notolabrus celidotus]|nr:transcription factor-like 5 protein isoform X2 [Notolabrus celidotus]XP_034551323.1 transcription factor-like 5 protein isoform X2 [Notolabrus celidotus]